jgi:hypothetical protein
MDSGYTPTNPSWRRTMRWRWRDHRRKVWLLVAVLAVLLIAACRSCVSFNTIYVGWNGDLNRPASQPERK